MRWLVGVIGVLSLGGATEALGARDFRAELIQATEPHQISCGLYAGLCRARLSWW